MMDALLTTFLSSAPVMLPPAVISHHCNGFMEQCGSDFILMRRSLNKRVCLEASFSMSDGWSDLVHDENIVICCDLVPNINPDLVETPLESIFRRGLDQVVENQKLKNTLQASPCSSYFSTADCINNAQHVYETDLCFEEDIEIEIGIGEMMSLSVCPCDLKEEVGSFCSVHGIRVKNVNTTKYTCTWYVNFDEEDEEVELSDEEEEEKEDGDISDFEIEFSSEICLSSDEMIGTHNITHVNVTIPCSDTIDFVDYDYDYDDDDDCWYDSSGFVLPQSWDSTQMASGVLNPSNNSSVVGASLDAPSSTRKTKSKYHERCYHSYREDTVGVGGNLTTTSTKRRVHFPCDDKLVTVHHLIAWSHAFKEYRKIECHRAARE